MPNTLVRTPLAVFLPVSFIAAFGAIGLFVWLTSSNGKGFLWGGFGDREYIYDLIVAASIFVALVGSWIRRLSAPAFVFLGGLGGYIGGLTAYYCLAYQSIERMLAREHYYVLAAPLTLATHLVFIVSGIVAALFLFVSCMVYEARPWLRS